MGRRSRYANLDVYKAKCREEIYQYREKLLGVGHKDVRSWAAPYPADRPESGRVRFLQIWAMGGPVGLEAAEFGLRVSGCSVRNTWLLYSHDEAGNSRFQLHLWKRPNPRANGACTRQHTAKGCDAELHDSWVMDRRYGQKRRTRRGKVIFRGTVKQCCEHAAMLFRTWDAAQRLGGVGESLTFIG